jgi:hypothetical protein
MFPQLEIVRLDGGQMPTFLGHWNGKPLTIRLDNSAVMKLEGSAIVRHDRTLPDGSEHRVALAAERLLMQRHADNENDEFTVTMTALDLD